MQEITLSNKSIRLGWLKCLINENLKPGLNQFGPREIKAETINDANLSVINDSGIIKISYEESELSKHTFLFPKECTLSSVRKLPHDHICKYLWGGENIGNLLKEPIWSTTVEGVATPDWFSLNDDHLFAVEVKTFNGDGLIAFERAMGQYSGVLQSCIYPALNISICVGSKSIVCSECLTIEQHIVDTLCLLYRITKRIQNLCHDKGWLHDFDYSKGTETVILPTMSLPPSSTEKLLITEEMRKVWKSLPAIPDAERLINDNIQHMKMSQSVKAEDYRSMEAKYKGRPLSNGDQILRVGLMTALIGDDFPPVDLYANPVLNCLVEDFTRKRADHPGVEPKHVYLRGHLESYYNLSKSDILRGLWSSYFQLPDVELFRSSNKPERPRETKELCLDPGRGSCHVSPLTLIETDNEIKAIRAEKKSENSYRPSPIDLRYWSDLLFTKIEPVSEGTFTSVEGKEVSMPYQDELWYSMSRFWQRLVEELNIGRFSATGKWNRFHVQKLHPYDAYLFVHGTGADSHQFYYLICKTKIYSAVAGLDLLQIPGTDWWYTSKIQSMNSSKINQWLNLHERLISLRFFWNSVFHRSVLRSQNHFTASFLIGFEAKQSTIDMLSLFRYLYMELCKEVSHRNVFKIQSKFPEVLRTPVQCWIMHSMIKTMRLGDSSLGVLVSEDDPSSMDFKELRSWVDSYPVPSFSTILSLSYMHYVVPHPFDSGLNGRVAIMEKLLREESKLPTDRSKIGWSSPSMSELGDHEFSVGFVKSMGLEASKYVRNRYNNFSEFWVAVSKKLKEQTYSTFSTFKKSTYRDSKGDLVREFCFKTIEELSKDLGWNVDDEAGFSPFDKLQQLIDLSTHDPGVRDVTIFVKDQQTGLREIFVLTMCMRILIKFMEIVSRVINTCLPNETLSVPSRKEYLIKKHSRYVYESKKALLSKCNPQEYDHITLRYSSSSDAKSWCQQFCMPTFGCFYESCLSQFGPESEGLIRIIHSILNLITQKHIHIDPRVKQWFMTHPDVIGSSDTFNTLSDLFNKRIPGLYEDESIVNLSNMMQGIPHETSSALHASYLMLASSSLKDLVLRMSKSSKIKNLVIGECVVTNMVSSDDSGIIFSLPIAYPKCKEEESQKELSVVREIFSRAGHNLEECKRYFSARVSLEKSTVFAETPVYEFNSKFYVGVSVNTAEIKFVCSPFTLGYHTVIRERVSEALSTLSGCLREGVRQDQLNIIQLCLRRMHHRFLYFDWWDSSVNRDLNQLCSPVLGTVPLIREGLIGFFNLQNMGDYVRLIDPRSNILIDQNLPSYDISDDLRFSLSMRMISRYQKVLARVLPKFNSMIKNYESSEELSLKYLSRELFETEQVLIKLMSPGSKIAMSYVDVAKIHMASCFAATQNCIKLPGNERKISLREAVEMTRKTQSAVPPNIEVDHNPTIKQLVEMLNDTYEVPCFAEQARFSQSMSLLPESQNFLTHADIRRTLVEGWRYGFSGERLQCLSWCRRMDNRLKSDFSDTFRSMDCDIRELDRAINSMETRASTVHVLCFKPLSNNLNEIYASFLSSSMSRRYSLCVGRSRFNCEEGREIDETLLKGANEVVKYLSMEGKGWKIRKIKTQFRERAISSASAFISNSGFCDCTNGMHLIICVLDASRNFRIDLRKLDIRGNKRFFISDSLGFMKVRTHWYVLKREMTKWCVKRKEGSPMLNMDGCTQDIANNEDFIIDSTLLKIDTESEETFSIKSNVWTSDSHKKYPLSIDPKPWESSLLSIKYQNISIDEYCELLGSPYNTALCKKITKISLSCGKEILGWRFWTHMTKLCRGKHGQGEHSLAYSLLNNAMPHWKKPKSEEPPPITLLTKVEPPADFEDFFDDIFNNALGGDDGCESILPENPVTTVALEELFSHDFFPGLEADPQDLYYNSLMPTADLTNHNDVIRSSFLKHSRICYITAATRETQDEGLFGVPEELIDALQKAADISKPIDIDTGEILMEPEESASTDI
uniref:RNA-directed RNA polymerase L n=1 Tax=Leptomonas moramango virus TaxID=1859148 RepID=A0A191Z378_9VIRU|nr:putative RNA dependent RNA polymerase [Leptomonas moramango virus]